jgi:hypothetical protein
MENACYHSIGLPSYDGNPLIEALPAPLEESGVIAALERKILYEESQRQLPAHLRIHALISVLQFFEPLPAHLQLEEKFARAIRFGYVGRNPLSKSHWPNIAKNAAAVEKALAVKAPAPTFPHTPTSFSIVGCSGTGKTYSVEAILNLYPQVIKHTLYNGVAFPHCQLVWLKIECPFDGSTKGLCYKFFAAVDEALGTTYFELYARSRRSTDELLPDVARVASIHSLGVLVIDEIQHLSVAKSGGQTKMMNFFVELINTIKMPIVLIGTGKAISVLTQEVRSIRRASGQGQVMWNLMKNDEIWRHFLQALWQYQYTKVASPLNDALANALFDATQGIADFAVKLYLLSQVRAILTDYERISEDLIYSVARDSLQLAAPFFEALRKRDVRKLAQYEDVPVLSFEELLSQELESQANRTATPKKVTSRRNRTEPMTKLRAEPSQFAMPKGEMNDKRLSLIRIAAEAVQQKIAAYDAIQNGGHIAQPLEFEMST